MPVSTPSFSGSTAPFTALNDRSVSVVKGGPRYPSNTIGEVRTVSYSTFERLCGQEGGELITYPLHIWPEYVGQLMWSNITSGEYNGVQQITPFSAQLFLAVRALPGERDPKTGAVLFLKWIPVFSSLSVDLAAGVYAL